MFKCEYRLRNEIEQKKELTLGNYVPELVVVMLYVVFYIIVSVWHEPWFDESEAWQIAKCASLREVLFQIPHYEGHPALWHIILMIPAKLGWPYEISLKAIGGIIIISDVFLLEFKCKIKRWIKLLIPFTYFFFYQYGINVRPYGLLLLFVFLSAITFKKRDEKPFRFVATLIGMCLSSAYGILFAGGIAVAWLIDIVRETNVASFVKNIFRSKRVLSLLVLLLVAVMIIVQILPRQDTYATAVSSASNNIILRLICALLTFIPECIITENVWSVCENNLQSVAFPIDKLVVTSLIGLFIWLIIFIYSKRKLFKYILLPYVFFAVFAASVYFTAHHIGLVLFILVFGLWINGDSSENALINDIILFASAKSNKVVLAVKKYWKQLRLFSNFVIVALFGLSIYWSVMSAILDYKYQYSYGRGASAFIKEYSLDELVVVAAWQNFDINGDGISDLDTNCMYSPVNLYPYFDDEFVANMNYGYSTHRIANDEENAINIEMWKTRGVPDVLIGAADVAELTDGEYCRLDYSPIFQLDMKYIWRGAEYIAYDYIYLRNDLLEEYGLTSLNSSTY